jgi:protein-tyrosine-phosphatase
MAEGFAKHFGEGKVEVKSAGTKPALQVSGKGTRVMAEEGIDISDQFPKGFTDDDLKWADKVILMGCGVECPNVGEISEKVEDWGIDDPIDQPIEFYREIRDKIRVKIRDLLKRI